MVVSAVEEETAVSFTCVSISEIPLPVFDTMILEGGVVECECDFICDVGVWWVECKVYLGGSLIMNVASAEVGSMFPASSLDLTLKVYTPDGRLL